ncbi:unnamed protein product [Auanema sp. JU1783]|nr:unnamed protein product [Auanema sp. JU1783]
MFDAYSVTEISSNLPSEVSTLACQKSSKTVYAGSKDGSLFLYTPSKRSFEPMCCRGFARKAVMDLTVCEEEEFIICVSDGTLRVHNLADTSFPTISVLYKIKPVHSYVVMKLKDKNSIYFLLSSKKRLSLFKWIGSEAGCDNEFQEIKLNCSLAFSDNPSNLRFCRDFAVFTVRDECFIIQFREKTNSTGETWLGEVTRLSTTIGPLVVIDQKNQGLIGLCRGESLVVFEPGDKNLVKCEVKFSDTPISIAYDSPFLIAILGKGQIEVHSLNPPLLIQSIKLNRAQYVCNGTLGQLYVGSSKCLWVLDCSGNVKKIVEKLIEEKHFDLAIQLADGSSVYSEDQRSEMKKQAALNLFNLGKFEEGFALHREIKTDVISIIKLFPELLPEKYRQNEDIFKFPANVKKRALIALSKYLSEIRTEYTQKLDQSSRGKNIKNPVVLTKEQAEKLQIELQMVDTTLLKCYLKTNPMLVDSLLRLHNNSCFFEDAQNILLSEKRISSLFILYETRKKHEMALELLYTEMEKPDPEPFFKGSGRLIDYLQSLGNNHLELIFYYAELILKKEIDDGLSIFIGEDSDVARTLDRSRILNFLTENCIQAVVPYLEHLVYVWNDNSPYIHENLVEHYVIKVRNLMDGYTHTFRDEQVMDKAGEEHGDLGIYRKKLIKFLKFSVSYNPQTILFQLKKHPFYEERALILGRLKQHEQALNIYTSVLSDFGAAEQYCELFYDKNDQYDSKVYVLWFKSYVCPSDSAVSGLTEHVLPAPAPDVQSAVKILGLYADKIETITALSILPTDTPLAMLSKALNAVLQTVHNEATAYSIRRAICEAAVEMSETRLKNAESTKIVVTNSSECKVCKKKIGICAFVRYPADGSLAHFGCSNQQKI